MDPFTIAAGISAIGGLFKGITGLFAGNAQAKIDRNAAAQAGAEAGVQAQDAVQQGNEVAARAATQVAANGGGFVGSSMGVIQNISDQAMFNGRAAAYRGQTEIQKDLYDASVAKAQGISGLVGSAFGAAGSLVGGFAKSSAAASAMASTKILKNDAGNSADLSAAEGLF